jgi:hypothetical protein
MRRVVGLLPCLLLGACYEYAPVAPASVPAQSSAVKVRLSRPMNFPISDVTVRDVVELQGEVASVADSTFRLSVFGLRSQTGFGVNAAGETVEFPRTAVVGMSKKRISPWRSTIFGALIVAGAVAIRETGVVGGGGGAGTGPGSSK